ncbi:hypothetical protein KC207_12040 [Phycicoccus sp. BSK3Z-2]|uniref:DUF1772 domain-containing protein n=1 Tax=Phycicoccus avicenniae TaxID=2828860 RepID=A0A941I180_9MICO|nr:hypothetical protein [Phycicoccus avicenniae]MBR7744021.1 hypothetical protein [Phycicoccus avicenniae]
MSPDVPAVVLAVVAAWHAAFQVTVTALVYPVLLARSTREFAASHDAHSRRITLVVGPTYLAVLLACGWAVAAGGLGPTGVLAVLAQALVLALTAVAAAPTHGALGRRGPDPVLVRRLRRADLARTVVALAGLVAACVAVASG